MREVGDDPDMRALRAKDKGRARGSFYVSIPRWRAEVACHINKNGKYVVLDSARWQKRRSHSKGLLTVNNCIKVRL
jgi:hypothetical protein